MGRGKERSLVRDNFECGLISHGYVAAHSLAEIQLLSILSTLLSTYESWKILWTIVAGWRWGLQMQDPSRASRQEDQSFAYKFHRELNPSRQS